MSLKEKSLILIEHGEWVFDLIGPLFREGLISRLGPSVRELKLPTMELSLNAYGVSGIEPHLLKRTGRFLDEEAFLDRDSETLQRLAVGVYTSARPIPFLKKESRSSPRQRDLSPASQWRPESSWKDGFQHIFF